MLKDKVGREVPVLLNEIANRGLNYRSTVQIIRVLAVSLVTSVKEYVPFGAREKEAERESRGERCLLAIRHLSRISHALPK